MAAIARPKLRENGGRPMSRKLSAAAPSVASGKVPTPVRVRLKRVNCDQAIPYPPDGQTREWWHGRPWSPGPFSFRSFHSLCQLLANAAWRLLRKPRDDYRRKGTRGNAARS